MATQIGSLFGDVSLRTANMDKSIKGIQKKLGAMGKDFTQFGKKLSLGLTAPIVGFGAASFAAFNKQAKAEAGLRSALESSGQAVESNMTKIKALASQIQKVTTVGDESSIALAQIGTSMGLSVEQMEPALKGAIGLSESFGLGIDTSMRIATTAVQGNTEMLERYMKDLKDIEDPSAKAEEVTKRLAAGFDLAKAKAKEGTGPLTQLGNAIGDLMEPIGKVIMEAMQPWIDKMKKIVAYIAENMSPGMIKFGVVIGGLVAIIGPVLIAFGLMATAISAISLPLVAVVAGVAAFGAALYAAWQFGDKVVGPWLVSLMESFQALWELIKVVASMVKDTLVNAFRAATDGVKRFITNALDAMWDKLTKIWDFFKKVARNVGEFNPLKGVGEAIGNKIGDVVFRARGGPLAAGQPAIVGEQGPELFVPGRAGMVLPNTGQSGGSEGSVVVHQHFNGNMDMAVVTALKNMKPTFVRWAVDGVREDGLRRV